MATLTSSPGTGEPSHGQLQELSESTKQQEPTLKLVTTPEQRGAA